MKKPNNNFEKILILIIILVFIVLSSFLIFIGSLGLFTKDYSALGDPYYTNQLESMERTPIITWLFILAVILIFILFIYKIIISINEKKSHNK